MFDIYKAGEYFTTAESAAAAQTLLDLFAECGIDTSRFEIRPAPTDGAERSAP